MSVTKLGRYDIIKPLGKGGMALVYEAHDPSIDRRVAIKTIRIDQLSDDMAAEFESRFRSEARAAGRLQHPNIVGVYDAGRDQGLAFIVMELVRGGDLKAELERGTRLTFDRSMAIMRELLQALNFAHEQGIIHRDIKPGNVMLDANGRVKLCDFGVARITDSGDATRTQGSMVGTLKYMSPEQVQGLTVDARTDLFAAGVVLYQLLTGSKPFEGANDFAIMQAISQHDPPGPSTVNLSLPHGIDAVVAKALAKNRDNRYASARDFALGLRAVVQEAAARGFNLGAAAAPPKVPAPKQTPEVGTAPGISQSKSGSSTGTNVTSPSAVSQEMELIYWKDIQDSPDPEDFQGFLQQFPGGVYAGLAQRRLRKLARIAADSTGSHSVAMPSPRSAPTTAPAAPSPTGVDLYFDDAPESYEATRLAGPAPAAPAVLADSTPSNRQAEARRNAEEMARRQVEDARRKVEDARRKEQARKDEEEHLVAEAAQAAIAEKARQEAEKQEQARLAKEARAAEQARLAEEARVAEAAQLAELARVAKLQEQQAQEALEARRASEALAAEEKRAAEEACMFQTRPAR